MNNKQTTNYNEIQGDLIKLTKEGKFDVIVHGNNCFCNMKAGIAVPMAQEFGCDRFPLELKETTYISDMGEMYSMPNNNYGDINKLGQIDYKTVSINTKTGRRLEGYTLPKPDFIISFIVVNAYTQYSPGIHLKPFDYEAMALCMRKMNHIFKGQHIGMPKIGAGLAGGDWERIKQIIQTELTNCTVTVVIYKTN
jgi:O-acetyl-ADP-ribose deacetylase (regulator of RNase III)